jgi:hypothetical protein
VVEGWSLKRRSYWGIDSVGRDSLVVEGRSLKRQSYGGMDSLGRDGLVVEGRSWKRRSCRGRIVLARRSCGRGTDLEKMVLWWRDGLG